MIEILLYEQTDEDGAAAEQLGTPMKGGKKKRAMLSVYQEGTKVKADFEFHNRPNRSYELAPSSIKRLAYAVNALAQRKHRLRPFFAPVVGYVLEFNPY